MTKVDRLLSLKKAITECDIFPEKYKMGEEELIEFESLKSEINQAIKLKELVESRIKNMIFDEPNKLILFKEIQELLEKSKE
jgi:ABC-type uncharacterized transport system ATPase subunit